MSEPAIREPVCVTGATGFVATHVIRSLLERGYRVRGTVRSLAKPIQHAFLDALPGARDRLKLYEAEPLASGSYDAAFAGCASVIHTASPYLLDVKDPLVDLVEPAVDGTLHALRSARTAGVRRVVLTSSMAAIADEPRAGHVFDERDWNDRSSLERDPYAFAKTQAERAAWRFVEDEEPGFELVALDPSAIVGPSLGPAIDPGNAIFRDLLTGVYPGVADVSWGLVDVRDVALGHVLAMENPTARGRYLCASETLTMAQIVELLRDHGYADYKLPRLDQTCEVGDFAARLTSYTRPVGAGTQGRAHLGETMQYDSTKICRDLGLQFMPAALSVLAAAEDLRKWGHIPDPTGLP